MFVPEGNILTNINKGLSNKKFYVSNENILQIAVLNALNAWRGRDYTKDSLTVMKSFDLQEQAWNDKKFMNDCLLWTLLTDQNQCYSKKDTLNEICYSGIATEKLDKNLFENKQNELINLWNDLDKNFRKFCLSSIYPHWKYGLKQIIKEFNVKTKNSKDRFGKEIREYLYPELNSSIRTLKSKLKDFYSEFIEPKLEEYQLLK